MLLKGKVVRSKRANCAHRIILSFLVVLFFLNLFFPPVKSFAASTWTVCASGCDYATISNAISNASTVDGDTISVSGGPYSENINYGGKNITIQASGAVTIQGTGANSPVVTFSGGETSGAVLDGFTIDNQAAASTLTRGISISASSAPTIRNCTIVGNNVTTASVDGAGIYVNGGTATIIDTTIGGNAGNKNNARFGAGLYATALSGPLSISGGTISQNAGAQSGGGIYLTATGQSTTISNVTISNNSAANGHGGALYISTAGQTTTITNATISSNTASQYGGAIYSTASPLSITGGSINSNTAATYGGGISLNTAGASLSMTGTTMKGNSGTNGGAISAMTTGAITIVGATIGGPGGGEPNTTTTGSGAGIYMLNTTGASSVTNSTINNNTSNQNGGGIYFSSTAATSLTLTNTNVNNNTATNLDGAGLYLAGASVSFAMTGGSVSGNTNVAASRNGGGIFSSAVGGLTIKKATINSNSTTNYGGGIYLSTAGATLNISDSYIQGNSCQGGGAGMYIVASTTATVTNCLISGNRLHTTTFRYGGGINNVGTLNLYNSTIASNYAYQDGGGLYANGTETIKNSVIWGNLADLGTNDSIAGGGANTIDYSCVQQAAVPGGTGNINTDPKFVNPYVQANPGTATTTGDYRLCNGAGDPAPACAASSPAIDTAGVTSAPAGDIVGASRPHDVAGKGDGADDYDMGAYEYVPAANTAPVGGYTSDNVIPAAQVVQATDGSGILTITWKGKDAESNSVILKTFEYSVDGGATWNAPIYGDWSGALSAGWNDNGGARWSTAATFGAASAHTFTFNTQHADVSGMASVDQSDVRIRFTLFDGVNSSAPAVSDNFRVDNLVPSPTISSAVYDPATDTLAITGTNFTSIATAGTDIKSYVNWTNFVWDINGDGATTADITFVLGDVASLTVTNDTTLTLVFTGAKGTAIEATAGYGPLGGSDTIDVTAGFIKDYFGNVSSTDGVSDGTLAIDNMVSGTVYTDEGVTNIGAGKTIRLLVNGASAGTAVTDAGGAYTINAVINPGDAILVYIDGDANKGTTVTVVNGTSPPSLNIYAGRVIARHDNGGSLSNANMSTALGAYSDADIYYSVAGSALTVTGAGTILYIPSGYTYTPGGNVTTPDMKSLGTFSGGTGSITINGALTIAGGTYTATSGTTSVTGNLTRSGGSFVHNSGTFTLSTTSQAISGSFSFFNLTKTVTTAATLTFGAGSTTTINGAVTLQGASGQLLSLVSSSVGTRWKFTLNLGATKTISYVSVKDSDASGSDGAYRPISPTSSTDAGNNVDWFTLDTMTAKVILVYSSSASPGALYPKSRKWGGNSWTGESTLPVVTTTNPKQIVVRTKPAGGNERLAAIRDAGNNFFLYSSQGGDWAKDVSGITLPANDLRSFDLAYEQASGRALVVYNTSAASTTLKYRVWNGTTWGAETAVPALPTAATVAWVRLVAKPGTNEVMLAWVDNNSDLGVGVWDGDASTWTIRTPALTTTTSTPNFQPFDVVYETTSGKAVVAYIESAVATPKYYTYLNGTWTGPSVAPSFTGAGEYLRLVADPRAGSNKIIMGVGTDTSNWLQVDLWDGASWDAAPVTLTASYSPVSYRGRAFDLAWESKSGRVMAVYGKTGVQRGQYRIWDGVTWASGNWTAEANMPIGATNPMWIQLVADPGSNEMFCGISDSWARDLNIHRWNGSTWLGRQEFSANVSSVAGENFMFSYRVDAAPVAVVTAPVNNASLSGTTYTISGAASDDYGVYRVEIHIQRDTVPPTHWTGAQWTTDEHWLRADNTTAWSYVWQLPADHGTYTYTITARATDNLGQIGAESAPVTGVKVYTIADPLTVYRNAATVDSSTQITASAWYSGDGNADSSTQFETGPSATGPWTDRGSLSTKTSDQSYFLRQKAISGLTAGTAYYIRITHIDPDGVSGTNPSVIGPYTTKTNGTTVTAITATVDDCSQVTVSAYHNNDGDGDCTSAFEYSTDGSSWNAAPGCGAVAGTSPHTCTITGLTSNTSYYFKATFSDLDGLAGTNPITTPLTNPSPYKTLATCLTKGTTVGTLSADNTSCRQLSVRAGYTGDDDADGSTLVEFKKTADSAWTTACTVTGGSPRTCLVTDIFGLVASTSYDVRVTWTDADGVTGTNPQSTTLSTPACGSADIFPPTVAMFRPMDGATVSGNATYPVRLEVTAYDRVGLNASTVKIIVDGTEYATTANPNVSGNYYYDWTPATTGYHTVQGKAADNAGNIGFSQTFRVYVNSITTDSSGLFIGDGKLLVRENTSQLCFDCHGGIQTHSSQNLSPKYGNWAIDCRTCHQPHNTANIFLIRPVIKTPNSGTATVDFRNTTGQADYSYATKTSPGNGPCEVCHTKTRNGDDSGRYRNTGTGPGPKGDSHFTDQRCTDCHKHTQGFSPVSAGNISCGTCHPDRWTAMNGRTTEYHMYMQNSNTTAIAGGIGTGGKYPSESQPAAESEHRRCIMCHADMDVFHYKNNPSSSGVSYNLRVSISVAPNPADPSTYTNKDFDGTRADGGICFSCHSNQQTKNTAKIKDDGTTYSPGWDLDKFKVGTHNYSVPVTFKADNSTFNATCVKCHADTMVKDYQSSTYRVGAHSGTTRSYLSNINHNATTVETSKNSLEENMCYQCHSMSVDGPDNYNPNGWDGAAVGDGKDGYNVQAMAKKAQRIKFLFSKDSSHPIDGAPPYDSINGLNQAAGRHRVDEGVNDAITPSGVQIANWNPAATRHVECMDCHNPHATNATPRNMTTWRANPYHETTTDYGNGLGLGIMSGYQVVEGSFGGQIGGANYGTWGVNPTYAAGSGGSAPTSFTKITNMNADNMMYQLCFKCHSLYAYGATKPQIPWGTSAVAAGGAGQGDSWGDNPQSNHDWTEGSQSDLSIDFNPYNYGMHPVIRRGRNQPAPHLNGQWPYYNGATGNQGGAGYWWVTWNGSYGAGSGYTDPGAGGTVNYTAATKIVTFNSGAVQFPTYYVKPGWKIQFTKRYPTAPTGGNPTTYWYEIKSVDSATQLTLGSGPVADQAGVTFNITAALGWAFVPPYGPWSTLACGDCHQSGDAADPAGPHGSDNPWILREINFSAAVDNNLDGDTADTVDYINTSTGVPGDSTGWTRTTSICYSCHRRDIYGIDSGGTRATGDPAFPAGATNYTAKYSRVRDGHPPGSASQESDTKWNAFGIFCLNCHGGETANGSGTGIGAIHGSNRGTGAGGGTAAMGIRLRNGAGSTGHTLTAGGGSCWTKGASDSVNSCTQNHANQTYSSTYSYTGVD